MVIYIWKSRIAGVLLLLTHSRGIDKLHKWSQGRTGQYGYFWNEPLSQKTTAMEGVILGTIYHTNVLLSMPCLLLPMLCHKHWCCQRNIRKLPCCFLMMWITDKNQWDGGHIWFVTAMYLFLPWNCKALLPVSGNPPPEKWVTIYIHFICLWMVVSRTLVNMDTIVSW